jgi:heme A synthase
MGGQDEGLASRLLGPIVWSVPVLVVAQAAMIGQTLFGPRSLVALHGSTGNVTFLLAATALALTWLARRSGAALLLTLTTVLVLFVQIGSGYLGHRTGIALASSVHVTLGVLVTAVSAAAATVCTAERRAGRATAISPTSPTSSTP